MIFPLTWSSVEPNDQALLRGRGLVQVALLRQPKEVAALLVLVALPQLDGHVAGVHLVCIAFERDMVEVNIAKSNSVNPASLT